VGTKVCLLVAGLFVIAAGYLLVLPLERVASQGPPFDCGTALSPAAGDFAHAVCGDLNQRQRLQGGALLLAAIALAGGGRLAFGPAWRRRPTDATGWPGVPPGAAGAGPEWTRPSGRPALPPRAAREHDPDEPPARPGGATEADRS
jgi:hypothetical protein